MFIIVFDYVLKRSSPVYSHDFYYFLPRDQLRDVTPRLGVFDILHCTFFCVCFFIPAIIIITMF